MTTPLKIIIMFVLAFAVCPLGIYAYDMPHEQWVALGNIIKFVLLGVIFLLVFIFMATIATYSFHSSHDEIASMNSLDALNKTGDSFDHSSVERLSNRTIKIKTHMGRVFLVSKVNGVSGFQELDRRGNKVGYPVVGNLRAWRFGKNTNASLIGYMKHKVEDKPEPIPDEYDTYDSYNYNQ